MESTVKRSSSSFGGSVIRCFHNPLCHFECKLVHRCEDHPVCVSPLDLDDVPIKKKKKKTVFSSD